MSLLCLSGLPFAWSPLYRTSDDPEGWGVRHRVTFKLFGLLWWSRWLLTRWWYWERVVRFCHYFSIFPFWNFKMECHRKLSNFFVVGWLFLVVINCTNIQIFNILWLYKKNIFFVLFFQNPHAEIQKYRFFGWRPILSVYQEINTYLSPPYVSVPPLVSDRPNFWRSASDVTDVVRGGGGDPT